MENLKKLADSQILSVKFDSNLSELHLIIEDDHANETIIEFREIIYSEYSRSYADNGPGFYIFEVSYDNNQDMISDYLKDRYGFKGNKRFSDKNNNVEFKWFRLEGDVCINIICGDIRLYSQIE